MTNSLQIVRDTWDMPEFGGAREIVVRSNAELMDALRTLEKGEGGTVLLEADGGPYNVELRNFGGEDTPILITSLDPETPAIVERMLMVGASHVALTDVRMERVTEGGPGGTVFVVDSQNVAFAGIRANSTADGFLAEDGDAQQGASFASIHRSDNVLIADNVTTNHFHAFGMREITNLVFTGNDISGVQGDGFRGGGIQDALFEGNYFHDFHGSTQTLNHTDMLQLWSQGIGQSNQRVVIRDNVFDAGTGAATQTIFIGHEAYGRPHLGNPAAYQDITIEGNVIYNGARNGIAVGPTENLTVRDNTVLWNKAATAKNTAHSEGGTDVPWIKVPAGPGLVLENNIAAGIITGDAAQNALIPQNNVLLEMSNPTHPNYVNTHFVNVGTSGGDARDLELRPDSPLYGVAGAPLSSPAGDVGAGGVEALMSVGEILGAPLGASFSAAFSRLDGAPAEEGATYVWRLEDGRAFEGETFAWAFETPGRHVVTLEMTAADGRTDTIERIVDLADPKLLHIDFSEGARDLSEHEAVFSLRGDPVRDGAFHLGDGRSLAVGFHETQLKNLDVFEIALTFRKDAVDGSGALVGQHQRLDVEILRDGGVAFEVVTNEGTFKIRSEPGAVLDTGWHELNLVFDSHQGTMSIALDGAVIATGEAAGTMTENRGHTIHLGKPWEPDLDAQIAEFTITAPSTVDPAAIREAAVPYLEPAAPAAAATLDEIVFDIVEPAAPEMNILKEVDFDGTMTSGIRLMDHGPGGDILAEGRSGQGFVLDGHNQVYVSVKGDAIESLSAFDMTVALAKDEAGGAGTVMGIHATMGLEVRSDGSLKLWMNSDGRFEIETGAGLVASTDWNDVGIRLDGEDGRMAILLNGEEVASGAGPAEMPEQLFQHLVVGRAWGGSVKGRVDDVVLATPEDRGDVPLASNDWYAPTDAILGADVVPALEPLAIDI